jgi:protein SCO1/2
VTIVFATLLAAGALETSTPALKPPDALREVGFDQKLGGAVPLDLPFRDETGREVRLRDYFGSRPVALSLVYFDCPMLCTVSLNGLLSALEVVSFLPGREFELLTISFDSREGPALAAHKKKAYLARLGKPAAAPGWHFLTGGADAVEAIAKAVGFRYAWDEETKQFAHPAGLVVLTPDGKISRYLYGIEYAPKDLRLALVESGEGKISSPVDQLLLYCYKYDPVTGRYGPAIMTILRLASAVTILCLGGFIVRSRRREKAAARSLPEGAA